MSKFYYKFSAESSEGKLLRSFHRAAQKAEREAQQYAKKVGAATYYEDPNCFTGGIVAVTFKNPKEVNPNIWRLVGRQSLASSTTLARTVLWSLVYRRLMGSGIILSPPAL